MTVVIHEASLRRFFQAEEGPVGRFIARKAGEVAFHAHNNATKNMRTGTLQAHLRFAGMFYDADGIYALVGTDATPAAQGRSGKYSNYPYPVALETGRDAITGGPALSPGGIPYGPYPFLTPALVQAGFRKI